MRLHGVAVRVPGLRDLRIRDPAMRVGAIENLKRALRHAFVHQPLALRPGARDRREGPRTDPGTGSDDIRPVSRRVGNRGLKFRRPSGGRTRGTLHAEGSKRLVEERMVGSIRR